MSDRKPPRVLVLGPRFASLAQEALPEASFEVLKSEEVDLLVQRHDAFDLVLMSADTVDPGKLVEFPCVSPALPGGVPSSHSTPG